MSTTGIGLPFSYPDYVQQFGEGDHGYLNELLRLDQPERDRTGDVVTDLVHHFLIADIIEGRFVFNSFQPPLVGPLDTVFAEALGIEPLG